MVSYGVQRATSDCLMLEFSGSIIRRFDVEMIECSGQHLLECSSSIMWKCSEFSHLAHAGKFVKSLDARCWNVQVQSSDRLML
jgi:hypothetical protein